VNDREQPLGAIIIAHVQRVTVIGLIRAIMTHLQLSVRAEDELLDAKDILL
jgi:hypothetical protein